MAMDSGWRIHDKQRLQSAIYRNLQQAEANTNLESADRAEMQIFSLDTASPQDFNG